MQNTKELATLLEEKISVAEQIVIVPHTGIDFDALGGAVGIAKICINKFKKNPYILVNDTVHVGTNVDGLIDQVGEAYLVFNLEDYLKIMNNDDLVIIVDTNNAEKVAIREYLPSLNNKVVIDHHKPHDRFLIDADYHYIKPEASSTSEIVCRLLKAFNVRPDILSATCLYAGIMLDTGQKPKKELLPIIHNLLKKGASQEYVDDLLSRNDIESNKKIWGLALLVNEIVYTYRFLTIIAPDEEILDITQLAKLAQLLLNSHLTEYDAAFAIGKIVDTITGKEKIGVSARSNGDFNVGAFLEQFGGGGAPKSAGAVIDIIDNYGKEATNITASLRLTLNHNNPK